MTSNLHSSQSQVSHQNAQSLIAFLNATVAKMSSPQSISRVDFAQESGQLKPNKYGEINSKYELEVEPHDLPFVAALILPKTTREDNALAQIKLAFQPATEFAIADFVEAYGDFKDLVPILGKPHRSVAYQYFSTHEGSAGYRVTLTYDYDHQGKNEKCLTELTLDFIHATNTD